MELSYENDLTTEKKKMVANDGKKLHTVQVTELQIKFSFTFEINCK
jgi:hypothetical protein